MSISIRRKKSYEVIEGELELTISSVTQRICPGHVGIVPSNTPHSVKAITNGKVIVVDYPLREASGAFLTCGQLARKTNKNRIY